MAANSLALQMLWWTEVVVSARALLFLAPVIISRWQEQNLLSSSIDDWFLRVAAFFSLFYFLVGIFSILGHRLWRLFHYTGLVLTGALSAGFLQMVVQRQAPVYPVYWLPAAFALVAAAGACLAGIKPRRAA
ncbi:MAG: hypothetical protein HZA28_03240 [Candidatus Omnitrophica bacterium]|nr:hypothetical protein [Candidatus Omnitrophota bacterium]